MPRHVLRGLIIQIEGGEIRQQLFEEMNSAGATLMFFPPDGKESDNFSPVPITREQLMYQYYGENVPSINT